MFTFNVNRKSYNHRMFKIIKKLSLHWPILGVSAHSELWFKMHLTKSFSFLLYLVCFASNQLLFVGGWCWFHRFSQISIVSGCLAFPAEAKQNMSVKIPYYNVYLTDIQIGPSTAFVCLKMVSNGRARSEMWTLCQRSARETIENCSFLWASYAAWWELLENWHIFLCTTYFCPNLSVNGEEAASREFDAIY